MQDGVPQLSLPIKQIGQIAQLLPKAVSKTSFNALDSKLPLHPHFFSFLKGFLFTAFALYIFHPLNMESGGPPSEGDINQATPISIYVVILTFATVLTKVIGWDDWTILLALLGNVIGFGLVHVEIHYGFGRHPYYLTMWQLIGFRKYAYGEWIQTFATLMWTKVSICLFLRRIPATKALVRPLDLAIVFLIVSNVIITILWIVQCRPVNAAWNPYIKGSCFSRGQLERIIIAQAIISAVSDFTFAAYPALILWHVQMKLNTKVALCCLMGLGILTGACYIVRTVLNFQSVPTDHTYGGIVNWYWRTFEVQMGIIAACAPTLRHGWKRLHRNLQQRRSRSGHTQLTDEIHLRPYDNATPMSVAIITSENDNRTADADPAHSLPPLPRIQKTTRVDVDLEPGP